MLSQVIKSNLFHHNCVHVCLQTPQIRCDCCQDAQSPKKRDFYLAAQGFWQTTGK